MKKLIRRIVLASFVVVVGVLSSACAGMQQHVGKLAGTGGGALIGALVGGSDHRAEGAAIGGALGLAGGAIYDNHAAAELAKIEDGNLRSEVARVAHDGGEGFIPGYHVYQSASRDPKYVVVVAEPIDEFGIITGRSKSYTLPKSATTAAR